jgi:hypothetical protein
MDHTPDTGNGADKAKSARARRVTSETRRRALLDAGRTALACPAQNCAPDDQPAANHRETGDVPTGHRKRT